MNKKKGLENTAVQNDTCEIFSTFFSPNNSIKQNAFYAFLDALNESKCKLTIPCLKLTADEFRELTEFTFSPYSGFTPLMVGQLLD